MPLRFLPTISRSRSYSFSAIPVISRSPLANPHTFHYPILNFLPESFPSLLLPVVLFPDFYFYTPSPPLPSWHFIVPASPFPGTFTRELHLRFAVPLAKHTLYRTLLTHAEILLVSIFSHSLLALFFSVTRKCSLSLSTLLLPNSIV